MAGGAEIMIYGSKLIPTPSSNLVNLHQYSTNQDFPLPALSSDNEFRSLPSDGKLQYTTPSLATVLQQSPELFSTTEWTTLEIRTQADNANGGSVYTCGTASACQISYSRGYTPILYEMNPKVAYHGGNISYMVDPKSAQNIITAGVDTPFIEARVGTQLINFEDTVDENTVLSGYSINQIMGEVGEVDPSLNVQPSIKFKSGFAQTQDFQLTVCSFDNTDCYQVRTVASIDDVSASSGFTSGGQLLTINGNGFTKDVTVKIDGVTCVVKTFTKQQIVCQTGTKATASSLVAQPGAHGVRSKTYNETSAYSLTSMSSLPYYENLALHLESFQNQGTYFGRVLSGYFKAPSSTNYKFYVSCDDSCELWLSTSQDPADKVRIIQTTKTSKFRDFYVNSNQISAQISLIEGNFYYLEARQIQQSGAEHISVGVEITQSAVSAHHNSVKEIQRLQINPTNVRETTVITIQNPDSGSFNVYIYDLNNVKNGPYAVPSRASASQLRDALQPYYQSLGSYINVVLVMTDVNGAVTTTSSQSVQSVYTLTYQRATNSLTSSRILFVATSSAASVSVALPALSPSSIPLSGAFTITCSNPDGTTNTTAEIPANAYPNTITQYITVACPILRDKFDLWDGTTLYNYYDDGRDLLIRFTSCNFDINQFTIQSGTNTILNGNSIAYSSTTQVAKSDNILYAPIPFDLLYTNEAAPQVLVTVNGLPAVCSGLDCSYSYVAATSQITAFTYSGNTLTITGTSLPTTILDINFGLQVCTIISQSTTSIVCSVSGSLVSGSWLPLVREANGFVPISGSVSNNVVTVSGNSLSPNTNLNPNGGTILTISGSNFPHSLTDGSSISLVFADSTICNILTTQSNQITCQTSKFATASLGQTKALTITINGQVSSSLSVGIASTSVSITSISPNSYSPVLKSLLVLTFSPSYSGVYSTSEFQVKLISNTDSTYFKQLNVVSVDSANRQITVKYGGAISGLYSLRVTSTSYGNFDTSALTFEAKGVITSYSPSSGSLYGGTVITITGHTFSTDPTDNSVNIGSTPCDVLTTSATQITCRTQARLSGAEGTDDVIVFLKTSEEAVCSANGGSCSFTWSSSSIPSLTSYAATFNTLTNHYQVTFTGTGFDGTANTVEFTVDGNKQQIDQVSSTQVIATITNITDHITSDINFHLLSGTPSSADQLITTGLSLDPKLVSITPNTGSPAGSIIIANVQGVGINTQNVNLATASGATLCSSVVVLSYGLVQCTTNAVAITSATQISVKIGSTPYSCANTDTTQCLFSTSSTAPSVSAVSISSDNTQIIFTGTNFPTSAAYTAVGFYSGIASSSSVVASSTSVTVTYTNGVPISALAIVPKLFFNKTSDGTGNYATNTQTLANAFSLTSSSSSIACSFAGGCTLQVVSNGGLTTSIQQKQAQITVCGQECVLDASTSVSTTTQCKVPALATIYSIDNFNISSTSFLTGDTQFSTNAAKTSALFDMDNVNGYSDSSSSCNFGMSFTSGHVGVVNQVKFFMNVFTKATYSGNLVFQGSQDGVAYSNIFTVGDEIHEGWNYYDQTNELLYRYYRFQGKAVGSCNVGEFALRGVEAINDTSSSYTCASSIAFGSQTFALSSTTVVYSAAKTPFLSAISPRYGTVTGGTIVTFTGTNFPTDSSLVSILIDNRICNVTASTSTKVTCITSNRPGLFPDTSLQFNIQNYGAVATQGLLFRYVSLWSDTITWGGEFAPIEGDTVYIPAGLSLLVDVDSTPVLLLVLVQGALIFPPHPTDSTHLRTFDATYILVKGGYLEIGTEQFPYTSQLIITMHGQKSTPEMPIYGNKVIGVMNGVLEMHGVPRVPWTELYTTANIGATSITLNTAVDWKVGETIVIAPTGYDCFEAEKVNITSVDNTFPSRPVIGISKPLAYKHYAGIEHYGTETLEMRAEVGLLTRNVIYRGDPETSSKNQFGAHIMLHSHGDESLTGRIEYIELRDVGQAFQLGRYPLHFHLIGTVSNSYIRGNAIHDTYNRAVTIHAVQYLRVIRNVAYNTMGHTFFIEDAVETKNFLDGNLAIQTKRSWSLLNTDQTPASFWITNPDNIFRNNRAAGSERYGFWFDLQPHSTGPSYSESVCPINSQLGEFTNNTAHSNGRYGLRIFHGHVPRQFPCSAVEYDPSHPADPFWKNPLITANFINFLGYKNMINGAIVEKVGDVRFINFKVADNLECGIEFSLTDQTGDNKAQINGALIVGHSANADQETLDAPMYGLITARSENFTVSNVKFYNFDLDGYAAIGTCSHCFHPASTDSGARTVTFSNLYFDSSVTQKIRYQYPYRDILRDLDGTLTGLGANTWATPYWEHNVQPECQVNLAIYDGIICNNQVQVRRIAFDQYSTNIFYMMEVKVLKYDDANIKAMNQSTLDDYILDADNYAILPFKPKVDPTNGWAIPFVTGHQYKIHWRAGLDFMNMRMTVSERWKKTDHTINLLFNFTDVRAAIDVVTPAGNVTNGSYINVANSQISTGDNVLWNDTTNRTFQVAVNGLNYKRNPVNFVAYRCIGPCMAAINDSLIENTTRLWSDPLSWGTLGRLPLEGEDVEILPGWNMVLDLQETPILRVLQINGRLSFLDDGVTPITLKAKHIFVRAGQLYVGNETNPYTSNAQIILYGLKNQSAIVYTNAIEAGNKLIANTANLKIYGQPRSSQIVRLTQNAKVNDTTIYVELGLDWKVGDKIGLAPTSFIYNDSDTAVIVNYDSTTGKTDLDRKLSGFHFGAAHSTASAYNGVDIRGEVFLLTRNVKIIGEDVESWGCQIVTSDFIEGDETERNGHTILDNVEIYNCSQYDTYKAALRFDGAVQKWSSVTNSAIYAGNGWGVHMLSSSNVLFKNNVVFGFITMIGVLDMVSNITLDGNLFANVKPRAVIAADEAVDPMCGLAVCSFIVGDVCQNLKVINNIVAGTSMFGITAPGHNCNDKNDQTFQNNVVHSVDGIGAAVFPVPGNADHAICYEGSNIVAYKVNQAAVFSFYKTTRVQFTNLTLLDNRWSISANIGQEGDKLESVVSNSIIYGETESPDCPYQNYCKFDSKNAGCTEKHGVQVPEFDIAGKAIFPKMASSFPLWRIKEEAAWGGASQMTNVSFVNFNSNLTFCGLRQTIFETNPTGADYHPRLSIKNSKFLNVHQNAVAYLFSPPMSWAVIDDCGLFPCTGPKNALLDFQGTTYSGTTQPDHTRSSFQILPNNQGVAQAITAGCKLYQNWNAYYCESSNVGVLLFESIDTDFKKRTFSPMIINNALTGFNNTLNEFMDHTWDGFYTGQLRYGRFPSLIETNQLYNITYTGTPPGNQRYKLIADNGGITVHIKYTKPGAYSISDLNSNIIQGNSWDDTVKNVGVIKGSKCGENRYLGVDNILEFYLTPNCMVVINPLDQILTRVRLNWTLDAFYSDGGATKFVDRLSASLGIAASTIKVVSVYQGSVQVVFQVINLYNETGFVAKVQTKLNTGLKSGSIYLGAQVLEYQQNLGSIITVANVTATPTTTTSSSATTTTSTSSSKGTSIILDQNGKPIVQVQSTNATTNQSTNTNTLVDTSKNSNNNLVKILLITIIIFAVFVLSIVVGFCIYRKYYAKTLTQQLQQINSDSPDDKKKQKGFDDIEVYKEKTTPTPGNVFTNIFKRRPSTKSNKSNNTEGHQIVVQNVESQAADNQEHQNENNQWNTYSSINHNYNTSQLENNNLVSSQSIMQQSNDTQKINLFKGRNVQVHSELSINLHSQGLDNNQHAVPYMISPSKSSFIIHEEDENTDVKIKTPSPKKTDPNVRGRSFGTFQTT